MRLHKRIRQVFALLRAAVAEELHGHPAEGAGDQPGPVAPAGAQAGVGRPATPAQVRAINALVRRQGLDLAAVLREQAQAERPEDLTIRQASRLIDRLKASGE
jgi:hypothetical protein